MNERSRRCKNYLKEFRKRKQRQWSGRDGRHYSLVQKGHPKLCLDTALWNLKALIHGLQGNRTRSQQEESPLPVTHCHVQTTGGKPDACLSPWVSAICELQGMRTSHQKASHPCKSVPCMGCCGESLERAWCGMPTLSGIQARKQASPATQP